MYKRQVLGLPFFILLDCIPSHTFATCHRPFVGRIHSSFIGVAQESPRFLYVSNSFTSYPIQQFHVANPASILFSSHPSNSPSSDHKGLRSFLWYSKSSIFWCLDYKDYLFLMLISPLSWFSHSSLPKMILHKLCSVLWNQSSLPYSIFTPSLWSKVRLRFFFFNFSVASFSLISDLGHSASSDLGLYKDFRAFPTVGSINHLPLLQSLLCGILSIYKLLLFFALTSLYIFITKLSLISSLLSSLLIIVSDKLYP